MSIKFARHLYVPEDGTRFPSDMQSTIESGLRGAGLAIGPEGDGLTWKPFRPDGELKSYCEKLGLMLPTIEIAWFDEPEPYQDDYLPPRSTWSRCPDCAKLLPTEGTTVPHPVSGELLKVEIPECISCGRDFDRHAWPTSDSRIVFSSRLVVTLSADHFASPGPPLGELCPSFLSTLSELTDRSVREVFIAW